ncbi:MAG: hypothetical protein LQ348_005714 [Seirophora lacunosa]|nr:MAG: hypothetical protein LQ348_005714 [Seirophora lacunosa]
MKAPSAGHETPSPKRQRTSRTNTSGKRMSYDMKYHPMDDVLRPAASAARKAARGISVVPRRLSATSESTTIGDESDGTDSESHNSSRQESTESTSVHSPQCRPVPPREGSPSSRRVTRAELNGEKPVMYSTKHHPADVVLRPAAAKKAMDQWVKESDRTLPATTKKNRSISRAANADSSAPSFGSPATPAPPSNSSTIDAAGSTTSASASTISSPTSRVDKTFPIDLKAGLTGEEIKMGWRSLSEADHLIYLLQRGAADGRMLPMSWLDVTIALRKHFGLGDFPDAIQAEEWVESLRGRYANVSRYLQEYFVAEPEPMVKRDRKLYYAEDLDVYGLRPGDRYFRHHGQSIVQPPSTLCIDTNEYLEGHVVQDLLAADDESEEVKDEAEGKDENEERRRGPSGYYSGEASYIRHVWGPKDQCSSSEGSSELEINTSMRNSISADIEGVLDPDDLEELSNILDFSNDSCVHSGDGEIKSGKDETAHEESRQQANPHRSRRRTDGIMFSVHEDRPGNTARVEKQVGRSRKSLGMDVPKENLRERSVSEEAA